MNIHMQLKFFLLQGKLKTEENEEFVLLVNT